MTTHFAIEHPWAERPEPPHPFGLFAGSTPEEALATYAREIGINPEEAAPRLWPATPRLVLAASGLCGEGPCCLRGGMAVIVDGVADVG